MSWRTLRKRVCALSMAAVLAVTMTLPASAAEAIGDGVAPTYDEAYYATLDYYGNLVEGSMVKSYSLNGKDALTDYGVYDEVVNLTDGTVPTTGAGGSTSFRFDGGAPDHFYFEGKTKQPFEDLPWSITLHYTLNGVPTKAEDLAGKQGVVEILLDILPNENASDYARYNYTLAATALFNQDDILSLEAEGAQIQLVGNLRTVLYLCLPGEEQHFTIRVGSNDFSFGGLTVLMVPATLAQLEEIAKLSERKDDLEEDYRALSGSLDDLLDALSDIQNGLYASASGLDQLNKARGTFSSGKGALYNGADKLRGDLSNLADLLEPVEQRIQTLSTTVTDSKAVLNEMTDTALELRTQLADMEEALWGLEQGTEDLKHVIDVAGDLEGSLLRLEHALGGSHINTHSVATNSQALVARVKNAHGAYGAETDAEFMQKLLEAQGMGSAEAQATVAAQMEQLQKLQEAMAQGYQPNEQEQAALKQAQDLQNLHAAAQNGMNFRDFCGQLPGVTEEQAKQMSDLWLIYSAGGSTSGRNRSPAEVRGSQSAAPETPEEPVVPPAAQTPEEPEEPIVPPVTETPEEFAESPAEETAEPSEPVSPVADEPETERPEAEQASEAPEGPDAVEKTSLGKRQMSSRMVFFEAGEESGSESDSGSDSGSGSESGGGSDSGSDSGSGSESGSGSGSESGSGSGSEPGGEPGSGEEPGGSGEPGSGEEPGGSDEPGSGEEPGGEEKPGSGEGTVGGAVVDLITSGLDSASARIDQIQYELSATLNQIKAPTAVVVGDLADLCGELSVLTADLDDAGDLMAALEQSSGTLQEILTDVDALRTVLNGYEPTLQEALANAGTLSASAVTTIRDTETLLTDAENLARSTGQDLDAGTKQSLSGLAAALRQTAKALALTSDVKAAKTTITDIIEDTWDEYTGDVNNILMMDATAEPVSLTDERNPAPTSIQVLIRTQEIKVEDSEKDEETAAAKEKTTFWGRVAQMFKDFWNAVTGIFR